MNDLTFIVLKTVIIIATTLVTYYLIPLLKYKYASTVISDAVTAMEQVIKEEKSGSLRKEKVMEYAKKVLGHSLSEEQINDLIEAAVFAMNKDRK
jgi:hypothetical protein